MDSRERALQFTRFVGLELKGRITTRGFTAKIVAERTHRSASALNRWLNGHVELPLAVLCETCELIGADPAQIIDAAYDRLIAEYGPAAPDSDGTELDVRGAPDTRRNPLAAKRGSRKSDDQPHKEASRADAPPPRKGTGRGGRERPSAG